MNADVRTRLRVTVDLSDVAPCIDDVTGYVFNKQFVVGKCSNSYFLLDVGAHNYKSWLVRDNWAQSVEDKGLSPHRLSDPKGWLRQWRHPATFPIYATLLLIAVLEPMLCRRRKPNDGDGKKL